MKSEIRAMAERTAARMMRTDTIYGMDEFDILAFFLDRMVAVAPRCTSSDLEGQRKFFSRVLKLARHEILKRSRANRRKLHMTEEEAANVRLLARRQDWREADEAHVKRVIPRLSSASRTIAEEFVSAEWRHLTLNEFLGADVRGDHVTLGELAEAFGLTRTTFIRTRWVPFAEEFRKVWSLTE